MSAFFSPLSTPGERISEALHFGAAAALVCTAAAVAPLCTVAALAYSAHASFKKIINVRKFIKSHKDVFIPSFPNMKELVYVLASRANLPSIPNYSNESRGTSLFSSIDDPLTSLKTTRIIGNPDEISEMPKPEIKFLLAHEVAHLACLHIKNEHLPLAFCRIARSTFTLNAAFLIATSSPSWKVGVGCLAAWGLEKGHKISKNIFLATLGHGNKLYKRIAPFVVIPRLAQLAVLSYPNPKVFAPAILMAYAAAKTAAFVCASQSRRHELQADRIAATKLKTSPLAGISFFQKNRNFTDGVPPSDFMARVALGLHSLYRSHPPVEKRCDRLAKIARAQGISERAITKAYQTPPQPL